MKQKIEELKILANTIYNISSVLKEYCKTHSNDAIEIENIYSLVEYSHNNIDKLNSIFINIDLLD